MKNPARTLLWVALALLPGGLSGCGGGGGDNKGILSFTLTAYSVNENGTPVQVITVQRLGGDGPVGATIQVGPGTASSPADFDPSPLTVSWGAGDVSNKTVSVFILEDHFDEPDETVVLELVNPTGGATIRHPLGDTTLTIVDNDVAGQIKLSSPAYFFGEDGVSLAFEVMVQRVGGQDGIVTATLSTADGTANSDPASLVEPVDFQPVSTMITFFDQVTTPVAVPLGTFLLQDLLPEGLEELTLELTDPTGGATVGTPSTVTIVDDDPFLEIPNPAPAANGMFGSSVRKLGSRILVGAPGNAAGAGRAYTFTPADGALGDEISRPFSAQFGRSLELLAGALAIGGQGNVWVLESDGFADRFVLSSTLAGFGKAMFSPGDGRLVIGAPQADFGGGPAGAIRVFDELTGAPLDAFDGEGSQELGSAFALLGADLLAGAPGGNGAVLQLAGNPLALAFVFDNPVPEAPSPRFGSALAPMNGAFYAGVPDADVPGAVDGGRVDLVTPGGTTPAPLAVPGARFGANILALGAQVAIQAPGDGPLGSGRVHLYDASFFFNYLPFDDPAPVAGEAFGAAMCEFDGALVVGAPAKDVGGNAAQGTVWIFRLPAAITR